MLNDKKEPNDYKMKIDKASISKISSSVPEPPYKNWQLKDLTEIATCKKYYLDLIGSASCKELLAEMEKDPRVKALYAHVICADDPNSAFKVKKLGAWFLWACNKYSFEIAKSNLDNFLDAEKIPFMVAIWVIGISVSESMELENGVRIVPIKEMPESEDKDKFLMQKYDRNNPDQLLPSAAVIHICEMEKSFSQKDSTYLEFDHPGKKEADARIKKVILLLNVINDISCVGYMSTIYPMSKIQMPVFEHLAKYPRTADIWRGGSPNKIEEYAISELNKILKAYDKLEEDEKTRIARPLLRLSQAKCRFQIDKILDLCMTLEMGLSNSNGRGTPSSKVFSLRGSRLIGRDHEHRKSVYNDLKELYKLRSKIIHSGSLKGKNLITAFKKIGEYTRLTEEIILAVIHKGKINWKNLILGGPSEKITGKGAGNQVNQPN